MKALLLIQDWLLINVPYLVASFPLGVANIPVSQWLVSLHMLASFPGFHARLLSLAVRKAGGRL